MIGTRAGLQRALGCVVGSEAGDTLGVKFETCDYSVNQDETRTRLETPRERGRGAGPGRV